MGQINPPPPPNNSITVPFIYEAAKVVYVDFKANNPKDKAIIFKDDIDNDRNNPNTYWSGPAFGPTDPVPGLNQLQSSGSRPVAFKSGQAIKVKAKFKECKYMNYAKGVSATGYNAPAKELVEGIYDWEDLSNGFPAGLVQCYESFEMEWFVSKNANGPWVSAGMSSHPLYVVHKNLSNTNQLMSDHSVFYHSCKNANGFSSSLDIYKEIFKTFTQYNLQIKIKDTGAILSYWKNNYFDQFYIDYSNPSNYTKHTDLVLGDGQARCGGFTILYYTMCILHGLDLFEIQDRAIYPYFSHQDAVTTTGPLDQIIDTKIDNNGISINPTTGLEEYDPSFKYRNTTLEETYWSNQLETDLINKFGVNHRAYIRHATPKAFTVIEPSLSVNTVFKIYPVNFMVKNWDFNQKFAMFDFTNGDLSLDLCVPMNVNPEETVTPGFVFPPKTLTCASLQGVPAQGNPNPRSYFGDHSVFLLDGKLYDPSYGKVYNSFADWEFQNISGVAIEGFWTSTKGIPPMFDVNIPSTLTGTSWDNGTLTKAVHSWFKDSMLGEGISSINPVVYMCKPSLGNPISQPMTKIVIP